MDVITEVIIRASTMTVRVVLFTTGTGMHSIEPPARLLQYIYRTRKNIPGGEVHGDSVCAMWSMQEGCIAQSEPTCPAMIG